MQSQLNKYFTILSFIEGISLLVLFFIAMPIKYIGGDPSYVKMVGPIHGFLFLGFVLMALYVASEDKWTKKFFLFAVLTSSIPFGMFWLERKMKMRR